MPGNFTLAQFHRWDAAIAATSPGAATGEQIAAASMVTGAAVQGMSDGIVQRLTDAAGQTRSFSLNAAMALRIADAIPAAARMMRWPDADGAVIARPDPD